MNYVKLQSDILKDFSKYPIKENSFKRTFQGVAKYNNCICVLTASCIYLIPQEHFWLDYEKLVDASKDFSDSIKTMLNHIPSHSETAKKQDEVIEIDRTRKVNIFHLPVTDTDVYINKKFLSYFEDKKEYYYIGSDYKGPIRIYDKTTDNLLGYVLPIHPSAIKK